MKRRAPQLQQSGKKLLIASSSYPFHDRDFHALFVHEMARALNAPGMRIRVVTPAAAACLVGFQTHEHIEIRRFGYPGLRHGFFRLTGGDGIWENIRRNPWRILTVPGFLLAFAGAILRARLSYRPNFVLTHWLIPTSPVASLAFLFSKARILHFGHGSDIHLMARLPGRKLMARFLSGNGSIVATSHFMRKKMERFIGNAKTPVIHLGVAGRDKPEKKADLRVVRLCYMGRLIRGKGLYRALDLLKARPDWILTIAGEGREKEHLVEEARKHNLRVSFQPPVLGQGKRDFLRNHHFFLFLPDPKSEHEFQDNVPVSILEALGHGLPVIATPLCGLRSLFTAEELLFVETDVEAVRAAIERIDERAYGKLAEDAFRIGRRFSWEETAAQTLRLLNGPR